MERLPELIEQGHPFALAPRDRVEVVFEPGGEFIVHVVGEMLGHEGVDEAADVGGPEAALLQLRVLPLLERGDDRRIGRGATDPVVLQRTDQGRLGVAGRRLGEVLLRPQRLEPDDLAFLQGRQAPLLLRRLVVETFLVHREKAGVRHARSGGAQQVVGNGRVRPGLGPAGEFDGHRVDRRVQHLAGHGALPDELVELRLILRQDLGE